MEHDDREYTDMLNDELKDIGPSDGLHTKVRDRIAGSVVRARRRNAALGTVAFVIVVTMALSSVTPVFGRNGTLPQVIAAMAAERQAQKMTKTLGTSTIQQAGAALLVPEATVQTVADSALSETDSILALVIADRAGRPVGQVVGLRSQGLGWGVIMAQLGISGHDISEAVGQAQAVAVASTTDKPAVSNRDGDKVVVNGEITAVFPVSPATLTVAGKTFAIVADTQLKYHGKAITPPEIFTKLSAGKLYATVQGTELADKSLRANLIIVQDVGDSTQEDEEQPKASNEQQIRGNVTFVSPTLLQVSGFVPNIALNTDTKVEQVGAGKSTLADITVGQTVQVHVSLTGTTYTAQQVHIESKYVKPDTASDEDTDQQGSQPASNEQQARGKVTIVTATLLRIDGYAHDILLNAATKVEQVGAGKSTLADITVGQTVQVHVSLTGSTYTATQVHIEDKYVKPDTASDEDADQQGTQPTSNEQQIRGNVTSVSPTLLQISGFAPSVVLTADTKVEQVGTGKSTLADITVGQTVQVHVSLTGTTYTATQVHIEDKYVKPDESADEDQQTDPSVKTWQGTIANVVVQQGINSANEQTIGLVVLAEPGQPTFYWVLPTSVLQDASHHTLTLPALQTLQSTAVQKVTIQGRLLADGTVDVVKLIVTTVSTTTTPEPTNPGKGKGNDKPGKN